MDVLEHKQNYISQLEKFYKDKYYLAHPDF